MVQPGTSLVYRVESWDRKWRSHTNYTVWWLTGASMALPTEDTNGPPKAKKLRQTSIISAFSSRGSVFTR